MNKNSVESLKRLLRPGASCVLTTHYSIDGDAIGSELALAALLGQIGAVPHVINQDPVPRIYRFLDKENVARPYRPSDRETITNADVIFIVDASGWERLGPVAEVFRASSARKVCIDHHATNDGVADIDICDPQAAAAGMLVYDLVAALGGTITPAMARALFVAIGTDTGWFRFSNTSPRVFDVAAELSRKGASASELSNLVYEQLRWERMALLARGFQEFHSAAGGKIAWMVLSQEMFRESGADDEDIEGIVDLLRTVGGVEIVLLFREAADGKIRISMRSKSDADVSLLAQQFGGGGHARAAGVRTSGELAGLTQSVLRAAEDLLKGQAGPKP